MSEQAAMVSEARSFGVAMGSRYGGRVIGFTTTEEAAEKCRGAGLRVVECYNQIGPPGWEIVAHPDVEDTADA